MRPLPVEFGAIYRVTGPEGDIAVFNDASSPYHSGFLLGDNAVTGLPRAPVRESAEQIPEADGGTHGINLRDRLPFTLSGNVADDGGSSPDAQGRIYASTDAMYDDSLLEWWPSTIDEGVFVYFREQQQTTITDRRPKRFLIAGVSEDAVVYSRTLKRTTVDPAGLSGGGLSSPVTSPATSAAPSAGVITALQDGSARKVWPLYVVTGPCVNPVITNDSTGDALVLVTTLTATEAVRIDTRPNRRTVDVGTPVESGGELVGAIGLTRRARVLNWQTSAWPYLRRGVNSIRLGFTSYSAGARLLVEWRDAWG